MLAVLFLKGLAVGFAIAAPVGPMNVLCVRRTLIYGQIAGILSGIGAAAADTIYGSLAAFGLYYVTSLLLAQRFWLSIAGGLFLIALGIHSMLAHPPCPNANPEPTSLLGDFSSAFFLTLTNPITIFSFLAVFTSLGVHADDRIDIEDGLLIVGVFCGSLLWWLLLSAGVSLFRDRFSATGLEWAGRISGAIIIGFGVLTLLAVAGLDLI